MGRVNEKFLGRSGATGKDGWAELTFFAEDYLDHSANPAAVTAINAVLAAAPAFFGGLRKEKVSDWREVTVGPAGYTFEVTVRYSTAELTGETGESSFSFKTSGGTQKITHSITNVHGYHVNVLGDQSDLNLYRGAIGATSEGVEGCDIVVAIYEFEETHWLTDEQVAKLKKNIVRLTSTTNNAKFKDLEIGECLFLGCDGSKQGDNKWQVTFYFAGSPNRTGITIGSITGIEKKGWEYLWVRYEAEADEQQKKLVMRPVFVGIEQVYYEGNFQFLGIGTN